MHGLRMRDLTFLSGFITGLLLPREHGDIIWSGVCCIPGFRGADDGAGESTAEQRQAELTIVRYNKKN